MIRLTGQLQLGRYVIVDFTTQDPTDKMGDDIAKKLEAAIKKDLFTTNWRLTPAGVTFRLGVLSGQLKGYETEDDIKKLAEQVQRRNG